MAAATHRTQPRASGSDAGGAAICLIPSLWWILTEYIESDMLQVVQRSEASTMMGLQKELNDAAAILRR